MSYQLWTSTRTGYRRRGTRTADVRALFAANIRAAAILEPLQCCPADAPALEMQAVLQIHDFDVAGVKETPEGPVIGSVDRIALTSGLVRDHMRVIPQARLVSESIGIGELMTVLAECHHVFVLLGRRVEGIVTRADLNKPPVRVYMFGVISLLELHLGFWVQACHGPEGWKDKLKPKRLSAAKALYELRRSHNTDTSLLACLQLCDKRDLVVGDANTRDALGLGSKGQAREFLRRAESLRNSLAHSEPDLVTGSTWPVTIQLLSAIESLLIRSDELIEKRALNTAETKVALWT